MTAAISPLGPSADPPDPSSGDCQGCGAPHHADALTCEYCKRQTIWGARRQRLAGMNPQLGAMYELGVTYGTQVTRPDNLADLRMPLQSIHSHNIYGNLLK